MMDQAYIQARLDDLNTRVEFYKAVLQARANADILECTTVVGRDSDTGAKLRCIYYAWNVLRPEPNNVQHYPCIYRPDSSYGTDGFTIIRLGPEKAQVVMEELARYEALCSGRAGLAPIEK